MENYRTPGYANYVNGGHQGMRTSPNPYCPANQYAPYSARDHTYSSGMTMPHTELHRAEGPPFLETKVLKKVATARQELQPDLSANFQKGFFQVDDKWTCYRRNYFHVACSFILKNHLAEGPLYPNSEPPTRAHCQFLGLHLSEDCIWKQSGRASQGGLYNILQSGTRSRSPLQNDIYCSQHRLRRSITMVH